MKPVTIPDALEADRRLYHGPLPGDGESGADVPTLAICRLPVVDLHVDEDGAPGQGTGTQLMRGEHAVVLGEGDGLSTGWLRLACVHDRYVGWARRVAFDLGDGPRALTEPTHSVSVPRTFLYPSPDLARRPPVSQLSIGSRVAVKRSLTVRGTRYVVLDDGRSLVERHLAVKGTHARDPVSVAEMLQHTPYLWGGRTAIGLDCSGLVQLCHGLCGRRVLRDADQQEASIGEPLDCGFDEETGTPRIPLKRGDLLFWKGHVAMARDEDTVVHASGHTMSVAVEGIEAAVRRIAPLYGTPRSVRRP